MCLPFVIWSKHWPQTTTQASNFECECDVGRCRGLSRPLSPTSPTKRGPPSPSRVRVNASETVSVTARRWMCHLLVEPWPAWPVVSVDSQYGQPCRLELPRAFLD